MPKRNLTGSGREMSTPMRCTDRKGNAVLLMQYARARGDHVRLITSWYADNSP
jgi:hypothetical protein